MRLQMPCAMPARHGRYCGAALGRLRAAVAPVAAAYCVPEPAL